MELFMGKAYFDGTAEPIGELEPFRPNFRKPVVEPAPVPTEEMAGVIFQHVIDAGGFTLGSQGCCWPFGLRREGYHVQTGTDDDPIEHAAAGM